MRHGLTYVAALAAAVVLVSSPTFAQVPKVERAVVEQRAVSGDFAAFVNGIVRQQVKPAWIGYSVPAAPGQHVNGWDNIVFLEGTPNWSDRPIRQDADKLVVILVRVEKGEIGRLGSYSPDTTVDAGGLPVIWLTGVSPAESVKWLAALAQAANERADGTTSAAWRVAANAITGLALHDDPTADTVLEQFVRADQPMALRKQAALWLGQSRGQRGYELLRATSGADPSPEFRQQVATALGRSRVPAAIDTLIQMARTDTERSVRDHAANALAQTRDPRALAFFEQVLKK